MWMKIVSAESLLQREEGFKKQSRAGIQKHQEAPVMGVGWGNGGRRGVGDEGRGRLEEAPSPKGEVVVQPGVATAGP